jgi:hypothetical protein
VEKQNRTPPLSSFSLPDPWEKSLGTRDVLGEGILQTTSLNRNTGGHSALFTLLPKTFWRNFVLNFLDNFFAYIWISLRTLSVAFFPSFLPPSLSFFHPSFFFSVLGIEPRNG